MGGNEELEQKTVLADRHLGKPAGSVCSTWRRAQVGVTAEARELADARLAVSDSDTKAKISSIIPLYLYTMFKTFLYIIVKNNKKWYMQLFYLHLNNKLFNHKILPIVHFRQRKWHKLCKTNHTFCWMYYNLFQNVTTASRKLRMWDSANTDSVLKQMTCF